MTWQAMLRLPDKAGALVDKYAEHIREIEEGRSAPPDQLSQDSPR